MTPARVLLDTDIVSAILNRDSRVLSSAQEYYAAHGRFTYSIITQFEILRGLKARNVKRKLTDFRKINRLNEVLPLTDEIVEQAADIFAELHRKGSLINDADILIGATALVHGMAVATNNERHFSTITGLQVENWLRG
jgi:tRNA(fMet)-specific endonuclease VapC